MKRRRERRGKEQKWAMVVVGYWLFKGSLIQESLMKVIFEQIFAGHLFDVDVCLGTPVWKGAIVNAHSSNMLIFLKFAMRPV